mgnify:CR=1 FL=1
MADLACLLLTLTGMLSKVLKTLKKLEKNTFKLTKTITNQLKLIFVCFVQIQRVQRPQDQFIYQFEGVESESEVKNVDFRWRNA